MLTLLALQLLAAPAAVSGAPAADAASAVTTRRQLIGRAGEQTLIVDSVTWRRGSVYELEGDVVIGSGGTLTIEPGTRIEAHPGVELGITRDGRLIAEGTIYEPIVLTCISQPRYQGCWRGLSVRGFAVVNDGPFDSPAARGTGTPGCREHTGLGAPYGGCDDTDSSGVLKYVRVEYASHGVELLAVGSRTIVDHLQVNRSQYDGLSITGGKVDLRHVFLTANGGFGLSWKGGWRGRAQFVTIQQDADGNAGGVDGSNQGAGGGLLGSPRSEPRIWNLTVVTPSTPANPANPRALVLRGGTGGELRNVLLYRPSVAIDVDDDATCQSFGGGAPAVFANVMLVGAITAGDPDADSGSCAGEDQRIQDPSNQNTIINDPVLVAQFLINGLDIVQPDLRPTFGSSAGSVPLGIPPSDGFFAPAPYGGAIAIAAVNHNNIPWNSGWTEPAPALPPSGALSGVVASVQRGAHPGAVITSATGVQVAANASGQYNIALPAGTHLLSVTGLPQGCGSPPVQATVPSGGTATLDIEVRCTVVTSLGVSLAHGCVTTESASSICWGRNDVGQAGDGSTTSPRVTPVPVLSSERFLMVATGYQHSCAIDDDGRVFCWGLNALGALGNGTVGGYTAVPVQVAGIAGIVKITAGSYHNCALNAAGEAWCWGWNAEGQTGTGSLSSPVTTPQRIADGGLRFAEITAGESHTCALTSAGVAWCWGGNARGESGADPASAGAALTTPTAVAGGHTFTAIDGGLAHSCALGSAGVVMCWGDDQSGQLGDGAPGGFRHAPSPIAGSAAYQALSTGGLTSCAVTTAGSAECWGAGSQGTLGNGTLTAIQSSPVAVSGIGSLSRIGVALSNNESATACAVTILSDAFCWGTGDFGQLGDGTVVANRSTPTQVRIPPP